MKVLCCDRGDVGSSVMRTDPIRCGLVEMVLVNYHARIGGEVINNYLLFAREGSEPATTLTKLGWESDSQEWRGEFFVRFTDLDKSKDIIRAKLEAVFPDIQFDKWRSIF